MAHRLSISPPYLFDPPMDHTKRLFLIFVASSHDRLDLGNRHATSDCELVQ